MPDQRVIHSHVAHSVYGPTGPRNDMPGGSPRPLATTLRFAKAPAEPPQSLAEHIDRAVTRLRDLSPRQRREVASVMLELTRDISFVKMVAGQVHWSQAPADEGRPL